MKSKILLIVVARLRQPSTYGGLFAIVSFCFGITLSEADTKVYTDLGMAIGATVATLCD